MTYSTLKETYKQMNEKFFVSYAVKGPINPNTGVRAGMPLRRPISGPVTEPSPLNAEYQYFIPFMPAGVL